MRRGGRVRGSSPQRRPSETLEACGVTVPRRRGIEDRAAADGRPRAEHHAVAARCHDGLGETELRPPVADARDAGRYSSGAVVNRQARPVGDRRQLRQDHVEAERERKRAWCDECVTAPDVPPLDTGSESATRWPASARSTLRSCT